MSLVPRLMELAEITGDINDPKFRTLMRRLSRFPDPSLEQAQLRRLTVKAGDEAFQPLAFRTPHRLDLEGPTGLPSVYVGSVARLEATGVREVGSFSLPLTAGHIGFFGATRKGKSMAVRQLLSQLPAPVRYLVIDPENDAPYAGLGLSTTPGGFQAVDWHHLKVGLFAPPLGVDGLTWRGQAIRNFRESRFIRDGGAAMLNRLLDNCEKETPGEPVSVKRLYSKLMQLRFTLGRQGREYTFFESIKNRLEGLMASPVYDCAAGFDVADLTARNTLLRCRGMAEDDYVQVVNDLLLRLAAHFQPDPNPVPKVIVVLEEMHRLTNPERLRRADISEPVVLDAARTLAKCRVSLVFVDQVPSRLPVEIMANVATRFVFNTIEGRDLDAIQRSMSLNHEQRAALSRLPRQVCVVQYANPSFPEPFCLRVADGPAVQPDQGQLAEHISQTLARLRYVPSESAPASAEGKKAQKAPLLSHDAMNYLVEIGKDQLEPVSWRDRQLGIPQSSGNALRTELLNAELISVEWVPTYSRVKRVQNTRLTARGYEILRSMKVAVDKPRGIGSWQHVWHQHSVAAWGRRNGYAASVEHFIDGKSVDVSLEKDGVAIAAEVLIEGVPKELNNLRDLTRGYTELWFCVKSQADAARLKKTIAVRLGSEANVVLDNIRFKLLREFQPEFDERGSLDTPEVVP